MDCGTRDLAIKIFYGSVEQYDLIGSNEISFSCNAVFMSVRKDMSNARFSPPNFRFSSVYTMKLFSNFVTKLTLSAIKSP